MNYLRYINLFVSLTIFSSLLADNQNNDKSNLLEIKTFEDFQRILDVKDKIEIIQLIKEKLDPLTDDEILDSKMHDVKLYYHGIKEMQRAYSKVRLALEKFSNHKNSDIRDLYEGAINFLNNQGKILSLVAKAIEKNPNVHSVNDLSTTEMGRLEFSVFKLKSSHQAEQFNKAQEKIMKELELYFAVYNSEEGKGSDE